MEKQRHRRRIEHEKLPIGARLQGRIKGRNVYAQIVSNPKKEKGMGVLFEGKIYHSISGAASAATGNSTNGWHFWKAV